MTIGVLANSASAVLGRNINREAKINPVVVTIISMGIGSVILLISGIVVTRISFNQLSKFFISSLACCYKYSTCIHNLEFYSSNTFGDGIKHY